MFKILSDKLVILKFVLGLDHLQMDFHGAEHFRKLFLLIGIVYLNLVSSFF